MSSEKWKKVNELFDNAQKLPASEWNKYLDANCGGDEQLKQELQSLLSSFQEAGEFIQSPLIADPIEFLAEDDEPLSTHQQIGSYKIIKEIGRGGMGAVYLATRADELFQKFVAIKLIKRGMDTDDVLRHFRNEQKILGNFDHPNIARLLDGGSTKNGLPYFVMEHVEGEPIDQYCDSRRLSITQRLELFQQVCSAVSYAHRNSVVHRDLKPSNILVTKDGVAKLLDFGIAKILQSEFPGEKGSTATGIRLMTPEYASPEQAQGFQITTLSDVYSLGVILYELLTGHSPYVLKNRSALDIARTITETQPQLPSSIVTTSDLRRRLRGDLDNIVLMAMRKEPERRYQYVDQLSEDIRRHIQGLPIIAHKDTFMYRSAKFIRRNKIALSIGFITLLSFAITASIIQWRADQKAKLFQEFGQEVTRIESIMRYAYLLPLHDIQQDKEQVLERLKYIESRMQSLGSVAYGPGYYSLGRGFISLHRYQDAYDNLILAWNKYDNHDPAVANALGLSLAMLYREKLQQAEGLYKKDQLEQRKKVLEKQYRDPALIFVKKGSGSAGSEPPEYVDALFAFLGKKYFDAHQKAEYAAKKISWLYEAKLLSGDSLREIGTEQGLLGKADSAYEYYAKAKASYLEAAKKGQSNPQIFEGLCSIQLVLQSLILDQKGTVPDEVPEEGVAYCEKALMADAKDINANLLATRIYDLWINDQSVYGKDYTKSAQQGEKYAHAALKIDPESGLAYRALGSLYQAIGQSALYRGKDPTKYLDFANNNYEKALIRIPEDENLNTLMGNNLLDRARYESSHGKDPRPTLQKAMKFLEKAIEKNPNYFKNYSNLGLVYYARTEYETRIGVDITPTVEKAIKLFKKCIEMNPNYENVYEYAGVAYLSMSDAQRDLGKDPVPPLDESIAAYEKSLLLAPKEAFSYAGLGIAHMKKAHFLQQSGKDPASEIMLSRDAFNKSIQINDQIVVTYGFFAQTELVAARDAIARGKSPEIYLKEAERLLHLASKVSPECAECLWALAGVHQLRAEYFILKKKSAEKEIELGIDAADQALKQDSVLPDVHAIRGELFLLRARTLSGLDATKAAQQAESSFKQAFKIKNILRKEYGKESEEAKRLAKSM
jgi:eukaryotic-like serine/threonine-protein kinase